MQTRQERNEILELVFGDIHSKEELAEALSEGDVPAKKEVVEKLYAIITSLREDKEADEIDRQFNEIYLKDLQTSLPEPESKPWFQRASESLYSLFSKKPPENKVEGGKNKTVVAQRFSSSSS